MDDTTKTADRGDATRQALIEAALAEFSRNGYHAASNREIALRAQANQALISYHFGGKEGLYLAVFDFICEQIQGYIGDAVDQIGVRLEMQHSRNEVMPNEHEEYILLLLRLIEGMARLFSDPLLKPSAQLILHEQQEPTKAFDILYEGFMQKSLGVVTELVQRIRPDDSREEAALIVATILGQVLVFRVARTTLLRHLEWDEIGTAQFEKVLRRVKANVRAILCSKECL